MRLRERGRAGTVYDIDVLISYLDDESRLYI